VAEVAEVAAQVAEPETQIFTWGSTQVAATPTWIIKVRERVCARACACVCVCACALTEGEHASCIGCLSLGFMSGHHIM